MLQHLAPHNKSTCADSCKLVKIAKVRYVTLMASVEAPYGKPTGRVQRVRVNPDKRNK